MIVDVLPEQTQEEPRDIHTPLKDFLDKTSSQLTEMSPERWWRFAYKTVARALNNGHDLPPEMREFILETGPEFKTLLTRELGKDKSHMSTEERATAIAERTVEVIHDAAEIFTLDDEGKEKEPITINKIPFEQLLQYKDRFKLTSKTLENGEIVKVFQVYSLVNDTWYDFNLPISDNVVHKGGLPRVVLKIIAGAPEETIEAELPPNDVDVIALKDKEGIYEEAALLGADPDGVELVDDLDYDKIVKDRDIDLNGCFIEKAGLLYSQQAFEAANSGKVHLTSYRRKIYGTEVVYYQGLRITNNRGMMRLLKPIVEGKALSFDFMPINKQIDFGIYWLVLSRKFMNKPQYAELLDKLYYLGNQLGQVRTGEKNIYDVLSRVHSEFPFFNFESEPLDKVGVAKWLSKKLTKQIDRVYRQKYGIPSDLYLERKPNDTIPYQVSLRDYEADTERIEEASNGLESFLQNSRLRTKEYDAA